jgi:subtilase family serine protease
MGGESTGSWKYTIKNLPYKNGDDEYESKNQSSLRPGESVEIIVGFDNPDKGDYKIEVKVDSDDDVDEESESNNKKTEDLEVKN